MTFRALQLTETEDDGITAAITTLEEDSLPAEGEVTVAIEATTLNYKDAMILAGKGRLVRSYPHVPGIDFAGRVAESDDPRYKPGDSVILTGWRVGEIWWGGYAEKARVRADWLVPMPEGMTARQAMAIGTAGLSAMLGILALEDHGLKPDAGEVLITGAAGGVGSTALMILNQLGYRTAAVSGRPELEDWLCERGAGRVIPRDTLAETTSKPLESSQWAGCVDAVGGAVLARILGQLNYGGAVAAIGNAGGNSVPANILPFLLRGITLLGIDSVMQPFARRQQAWHRLAEVLTMDKLEAAITDASLEDLPDLATAQLKGETRGRLVVNL